jgi:hypothetical protein
MGAMPFARCLSMEPFAGKAFAPMGRSYSR